MNDLVKHVLIGALVAGMFAIAGFFAGRFLAESPEIVDQLRLTNNRLSTQIAALQTEYTDLRERNAKLQADIAGGRTIDEERKALATRSQELERREKNVIAMDQELAGRQAKLRQSENEFYEATNLTQQEIGQAKQITKEYEAMRQARDDALALANRWLMFIYGLTIAVGILLIVDWKKRKDRERGLRAIEGLREALDQHMTPDQRNAIVAAVAKVAGLLPAP